MLSIVSLIELCISCQHLKIVLDRLNKENEGLSKGGHSISHFNLVYTSNFKRTNDQACLAFLAGQRVTVEVRKSSEDGLD